MNSETLITKRSFFLRKMSRPQGMDAGLVALKLVLKGYGINVSDKFLLEAAVGKKLTPTEIAQVAEEVGLFASPVIIPLDYFLKASNWPAIVLISSGEKPRWLVVWDRVGPVFQVMDPRMGQRRWLTEEALLSKLNPTSFEFEVDEWLEEVNSEVFTASLRGWLVKLGVDSDQANRLIETSRPDWTRLATLDAATRMLENMVQYGGFRSGKEASAALEQLFIQAYAEFPNQKSIPSAYWSVVSPSGEEMRAARSPSGSKDKNAGKERLIFKGVALLKVLGCTAEATKRPPVDEPQEKKSKKRSRGPNVKWQDFWRQDGQFTPIVLGVAVAFSAANLVLQALLFRGFMEVGGYFSSTEQRFHAMVLLFVFVLILLVLQLPLDNNLSRIGRRVDVRLRMAVLKIIPYLSNQYFQKYSRGDLTERVHGVRALHILPSTGSKIILLGTQILLTTLAIAFIDLGSAPIAILNALGSLIVLNAISSSLLEQYLEVRSKMGSLSRFYLDALLGLVAVRTHGAEEVVRREYESLLVEWSGSKLGLFKLQFYLISFVDVWSHSLIALLILSYVIRGVELANLPLLLYWVQNMALQGEQLIHNIQSYIGISTYGLRFAKLLDAPRERELYVSSDEESSDDHKEFNEKAVKLTMNNVSVNIAKRTILSEVNLTIEAGSQMAIVGPSGAGKSTLVGLLIGRYTTPTGEILIDDQPFTYERLQQLRREMAWVDPSVQLWNRSLLDNLRYGISQEDEETYPPLELIIEQADLLNVLSRLPDGLQTILGGGGRLVSGGQGQRVRFGRAMQRQNARLVILDEPFRGLDREKRRLLLERARNFWPDATLICVTHDVGETQVFERVLVVENGLIIEDDSPSKLANKPNSRYRALLEAEKNVREKLWSGEEIPWRQLWLDNGKLSEKVRDE